MPRPVEPPRPPRRASAEELRSQLAMELALHAYAVFAAFVTLRSTLRALGVGRQVWIGDLLYGLTDPVVRPLLFLPGASVTVFGRLTLADATLLATIVLVPIGLLARKKERRHLL